MLQVNFRQYAPSERNFPTFEFELMDDRVAGLALLLDDVAQNSRVDLGEKQTRDLSCLIQACRELLEELSALVKNYNILAADKKSPSFGDKFRKGSKKLGWDQDEIRDLRSRIISNTTLLNAFNSNLAR